MLPSIRCAAQPFGPHLTVTPLRFAIPSSLSDWEEDSHLQAVEHARHTDRIERAADARWRNRPIEGAHPYVYLDGIVLKRSWTGEVRNVPLPVAIGVSAEGFREILGIGEGAKEDKAGWSGFPAHLKQRGLGGVELVISDACLGQVEKAIHAQEDRAAAEAKARDVTAKLRAARMRKAADRVEQGVMETLGCYAFPEPHWRRVRTNNPLERIIREIRRRTRVVGAFPDGESALNLAAARLRHIAGTHGSTKRYLDMPPLHETKLKIA